MVFNRFLPSIHVAMQLLLDDIILEVPTGPLQASTGHFSYVVGKGGVNWLFSWLQSATSLEAIGSYSAPLIYCRSDAQPALLFV